jgi:uncharacterized membrane protein YbhN (UPF0104 family)
MTREAPRSTATAPWRGLLLALGLGLVVYLALGLVTDMGHVATALSRYRWPALMAALALASANYLIRFAKWQFYLHLLRIDLPRLHSLVIFLAGLMMSVTPAKVGEVLRSLLLREAYQVPLERSAPIVVADRLTDLLALLILMSLGAATFHLGWTALVAGSLLCALVLLAVQVPALGSALIGLARRLPVIRAGGDRIAEAYESLRCIGSGRALLWPVFLSVIGWFCECLAFFLIVHGFAGGSIDLFTATFVYALATVAGAVAMLPGGLGATEASMAGLLVALPSGLAAPEAAAATLLIRVATLWFAVFVGLVALPVHRAITRRLQPCG